jgi:hypothetical protein
MALETDNEDRLDIDLDNLSSMDPDDFDSSKYDRGDSVASASVDIDDDDDDEEEVNAAAAVAAAEKKAAEEAAAKPPATPEEEEAAAAAEAAAAPAVAEPLSAKKPIFIPKDRFDSVNTRMKTAEAEAQELRAKLEQALAAAPAAAAAAPAAAQSQFDDEWFDDKERQYADLVADGSVDEALALRKEIRTAEREVLAAESTARATAQVAQDTSTNTLRTRIQENSAYLASLNPSLDDTGDSFNEADVSKIVAMQRGLMATKQMPADEALMEAAEMLGFATAVAGDETPAALSAEALAAKKTERAALRRKVGDAAAQPPAGGGRDPAKAGDAAINVASLSIDEFDALPEATKQRLRGDTM